MSNDYRNEEELVEAINQLPRSKEPRRELWPAIEARLGAGSAENSAYGPRVGWRNQAVAASVAVAFVAGLLFGRQVGIDTTPAETQALPDLVMQATLEATEREYQAAFMEFIPVGTARAVLETQAVENIENTWAELQQAESALLSALRDYPENTYLNQKLLDLRSQQLGFMKQLAMLDQYSRRKT
jgi:hypothetical protein